MAAAAAAKPPVSRSSTAAWLLLLVAVAAMQTTRSIAQSCMSELSNLNVCAPFLLPGASGSASPDCCNALQSVQHDCLCSTLRIASRLPSVCNLPPFSCTR